MKRIFAAANFASARVEPIERGLWDKWVVLAALAVTVGLGLAGTLLALNQKPASVLRNL